MNSEQPGGSDLLDIQNWMQAVVMQPTAPLPEAPVEAYIRSSKRLSARRHLQLYRQSYIARLRDCMKKEFSALNYTLGEDLFEQFADQYLQQHPSNSYSLNTLGEKFPAFLAATRPDKDSEEKENWIDFMIELAQFEYHFSELFDQPEPENHQPIVKAFKHSFPVGRYYLEFSQGKEPGMYLPEVSYCLVRRENFRLSIQEISKDKFDELQTNNK